MNTFQNNCQRLARRRHRWQVVKACLPALGGMVCAYLLGLLTMWACLRW